MAGDVTAESGFFGDVDPDTLGAGAEPPPGIDLSLVVHVPDEEDAEEAARREDAARREAWRNVIATVRENDKALASAAFVLLSLDPALARLVAAWPTVAPEWPTPKAPAPVDPPAFVQAVFEVWRGVWNPADPKAQLPIQVAAATALTPAGALTALRVGVQNRLILPTGEISQGAEAYLRAEASSAIRRLRGREPARPAAKASA